MSTPDYGPSGYLPPKAAKRARKIILREQMGRGWPLAAVAAAVIVVVAGLLFLRGLSRPPGEPFVLLGAVTDVEPGTAAVMTTPDVPVVVARAGGAVRAFVSQHDSTVWCPESQRLEAPDSAWRLDGTRTHGAGESLRPLDAAVFDGLIYVDVATVRAAPPAAPGNQPPVCLRVSSSNWSFGSRFA